LPWENSRLKQEIARRLAVSASAAYRYGLNGDLSGIATNAAQTVLANSQFAATPQALQPLAGLQDGLVKLS